MELKVGDLVVFKRDSDAEIGEVRKVSTIGFVEVMFLGWTMEGHPAQFRKVGES